METNGVRSTDKVLVRVFVEDVDLFAREAREIVEGGAEGGGVVHGIEGTVDRLGFDWVFADLLLGD